MCEAQKGSANSARSRRHSLWLGTESRARQSEPEVDREPRIRTLAVWMPPLVRAMNVCSSNQQHSTDLQYGLALGCYASIGLTATDSKLRGASFLCSDVDCYGAEEFHARVGHVGAVITTP